VVLDRDQISALQTSDLNVLPLAEAQQLWLCCRHDPLVEEIARRACRSQ
jgi:hypothetical protein